jgi:hypothetical protein
MTDDLATVGLQKGDRLIPDSRLHDVALFDELTLPITVRFFKFDKNSRLTNVTPLYDVPNISSDTICIDLLHAWHLGGCSEFIGEVMHFVIGSGIYTRGAKIAAAADAREVSLIRLKADVWAYYQRRAARDPDFKSSGTRVHLPLRNLPS